MVRQRMALWWFVFGFVRDGMGLVRLSWIGFGMGCSILAVKVNDFCAVWGSNFDRRCSFYLTGRSGVVVGAGLKFGIPEPISLTSL